MSKWPRDNQADLLKFYGTPGREVESQLVPVIPPFKMYYEGNPIRNIQFHRKAATALLAALNEIWEAYGRDQAVIDAMGISRYDGAYNPRYIRGSTTKWSNHAYGAAIDINAKDNGFNTGHGTMPAAVINAFKRQGARWGGDYRGRTDPMHFEFCDNGEPDAVLPQPVEAPVAVVPTPVMIDKRLKMAKAILDFEARRDPQGHLAVYHLPANDGGGRYEVAGINEKYDKAMVDKLVKLLQDHEYDEAERTAIEYIAKNTDGAIKLTTIPSVESYLRDCIFNRGEKGAIEILQMALGVKVDGIFGDRQSKPAMRIAEQDPNNLLTTLRAAREHYERTVVGVRDNLWRGLVSRWDKALEIAKEF